MASELLIFVFHFLFLLVFGGGLSFLIFEKEEKKEKERKKKEKEKEKEKQKENKRMLSNSGIMSSSSERIIVRVWEPQKEKEGRKTLALTKTTTTKQLSEQVSRKLGVQARDLKLIAATFGNQRTLELVDCPWDAFESGGFFFFLFFFFFFFFLFLFVL